MQEEIDQLRADQEVPIEELRRQYAGAAMLSDDDGDSSDVSIGEEAAASAEVHICCYYL